MSSISNELNTTCSPLAMCQIFSSFLIFTPVKHEKLRQYWSYCRRDSAITNARAITHSLIKLLVLSHLIVIDFKRICFHFGVVIFDHSSLFAFYS